jgi:hypothetical protein
MNKRKHKELVQFVHQKMPDNLHICNISRPFGIRHKSMDSLVMAYMVVYLCHGSVQWNHEAREEVSSVT